MDKEKLITKIIFGVEDLSEISLPVSEEVKENFEIAWDICENFQKIKEKLLLRFFQDLKEDKVEKELPIKEHGLVFKLKPGLYISKRDWQENPQDRGIYAISVEKWRQGLVFGIVKNKSFKTDKESEITRILTSLGYTPEGDVWWIVYIKSFMEKEFYEKLLSDSDYDNLLEESFSYLKKVYEDLTGNEDLLKLFEESVKERKRQLNLDRGT